MTEPVDVYVGNRLCAARKLQGLSQEQVALTADLSYQQIQKYEKGINRISASKLVRLAVLLKCPIEWFFEGAPGYKKPGLGEPDISANFFALPYASDVATNYAAIKHNADRAVVRSVTSALARK